MKLVSCDLMCSVSEIMGNTEVSEENNDQQFLYLNSYSYLPLTFSSTLVQSFYGLWSR
jgi:hypothetical protein